MNSLTPSCPERKTGNSAGLRSVRRITWSKEEEALLGKLADWEVAKRLQRKLSTVRARRERLRILPAYLTAKEYPRFVSQRLAHLDPWTAEQDNLLGHFSDREVADLLGRSPWRVTRRRRKLNIPPCFPVERPLAESPGRTPKQLGKLFARHQDRELCAILRWDYDRVRAMRRRIDAFLQMKNRPWTAEEEKLLGTAPDQVVARKIQRTFVAVRAHRLLKGIRLRAPWRPADDEIIGSRPDKQVAMLLKREVNNIGWRRRILGRPPKGKAPRWTPEEDELLGKLPDEELAQRLGRRVLAVQARRCRLEKQKSGENRRFRPRRPWTGEGDALLGTLPDEEVAKRLGYSLGQVRTRRQQLGRRQPNAKHFRWTEAERALLGQMPDEAIAKRMGIPVVKVGAQRQKLGRADPGARRRAWTTAEIAQLGKMTDRDAATKLQRLATVVRNKRRELGIPFFNPEYHIWDSAHDKLLGVVRDEEIAKITGLSVKKIGDRRHRLGIAIAQSQKRRWTADEEKLLGTAVDAEVAAKLGRSGASVQMRRLQLGIAVVAAPPRPRPGTAAYRKWDAQDDHMLGVLRDEEVARQTGCRVGTVRVRRHTLRIPIAQSQRRSWTAQEEALLGKSADLEVAARLGRTESAVSQHREALGIPAWRGSGAT